MDHLVISGLVEITDEFHGDLASVPGLQWQVLIADVAYLLQLLQHLLVRNQILKRTQVADGLADHVVMGESKQLDEEGIHVGDAPCG